MMRVEAATESSDHRPQRKSSNLKRSDIEAHEIGHTLIIMDSGDGDTKAGHEQEPHRGRYAYSEVDYRRQADKGSDRIARRSPNHLQIENGGADDLAQSERCEREINATCAQHWGGDDDSHQPSNKATERNGNVSRDCSIVCQEG